LLNLSAYINQNLEKDLPLSTLAKRVGLSPFHFHRKFGAYFGESLHQHIKRLRLERAAFALIHGSAPVRQIARDSGYKTVSAFSHAFSGFAGESPTRYRSLAATGNGHDTTIEDGALEPAWIGDIAPQDFLFIRAVGQGRDVQHSIREAVAVVMELVGPMDLQADRDGAADESAEPLDCIAATSDVYGIFKGGEFRVDVGFDAARVPPERSGTLGKQTLPGGRYARFEVHGLPEDLAGQFARISLRDLQNRGETPRLSQFFVRFSHKRLDDTANYQLFIPLEG
jgi:AraC-like DNA-binding protein